MAIQFPTSSIPLKQAGLTSTSLNQASNQTSLTQTSQAQRGGMLPRPTNATTARDVTMQGVSPSGAQPTQGGAGLPTDFQGHIKDFLEHVDGMQKTAENKVQGFAEGKHNDIHGTMVTMQKADIAFRFTASIRNRLIEAYREVMRMGA